jgi:hypothetical protein
MGVALFGVGPRVARPGTLAAPSFGSLEDDHSRFSVIGIHAAYERPRVSYCEMLRLVDY